MPSEGAGRDPLAPGAASLFAGVPEPAAARDLLQHTMNAARLSAGMGAPASRGLLSLRGGVDVEAAPYAELLDAVGGWGKRHAAARVLFADAARQASAALAVAAAPPPLLSPPGALSPRRARSLARAASAGPAGRRLVATASAFAASAAPALSQTMLAAAQRSVLASPLRQGYREPCGLQSFNWTGLLRGGSAGGGGSGGASLRDPLLDAEMPTGVDRDPTLRAMLRLQRARVLAAAHATARTGAAAAAAAAAAPFTSSSSSSSSSSTPAPAAAPYTASEMDGRRVHRALFRAGGGFDARAGAGADAAALARASASAGEQGYSWASGSARALSTQPALPPPPPAPCACPTAQSWAPRRQPGPARTLPAWAQLPPAAQPWQRQPPAQLRAQRRGSAWRAPPPPPAQPLQRARGAQRCWWRAWGQWGGRARALRAQGSAAQPWRSSAALRGF